MEDSETINKLQKLNKKCDIALAMMVKNVVARHTLTLNLNSAMSNLEQIEK